MSSTWRFLCLTGFPSAIQIPHEGRTAFNPLRGIRHFIFSLMKASFTAQKKCLKLRLKSMVPDWIRISITLRMLHLNTVRSYRHPGGAAIERFGQIKNEEWPQKKNLHARFSRLLPGKHIFLPDSSGPSPSSSHPSASQW